MEDAPTDIDLESPQLESREQQQHQRRRRVHTRTARLIGADIREVLASTYKNEVRSVLRWRGVWKKFGDSCEAISKGLTGVSAVLAFAASAIRDTKTADILSFSAGSVGTIGLVLLTYSNYAIKESRERTQELNSILERIGVTPMPDIATQESSAGAD
jgi:hypothetical protein